MPDLSPTRLYALAKHIVVFEIRLYRSLWQRLVRGQDRGGPEDAPFTDARTVTRIMWLWMLFSPGGRTPQTVTTTVEPVAHGGRAAYGMWPRLIARFARCSTTWWSGPLDHPTVRPLDARRLAVTAGPRPG
jgi:hypothetical protein